MHHLLVQLVSQQTSLTLDLLISHFPPDLGELHRYLPQKANGRSTTMLKMYLGTTTIMLFYPLFPANPTRLM